MGLWIKNEDGSVEKAAGGGGSGGGSAGGTAWNPLYESFNETGPFEFSTNNAFSLDTADVDDEVAAAAASGPVDPPLVRTWTNTNSFDVAFRIEYQGFVYGSGSRTSYTKIVLRGDGVTDAYSPTCRNWGGMADSTTQVHQGVTGFASCKVEAGATVTWELEAYENIEGSFHNLKWLNFSMGCVPLDSTLLAGGGGAAGPHDHAYLPLAGGTLTGDLAIAGNQPLALTSTEAAGREYVQFNAGPSAMTMYGGNDANYPNEVRFESNRLLALSIDGTKQVRAHGNLQVDGNIKPQANGSPSNPGILFGANGAGVYGYDDGVGFTHGGTWQLWTTSDLVRIKPNLQVDGTINGQVVFGIAAGIDTADVLDRAETATMPAVDDEGVATMDAEVEGITVNEVVTALLAKVKELSATVADQTEKIAALEAN